MNFKKSPQEIYEEILWRAQDAIHNSFYSIDPYGYSQPGPNMHHLTYAMSQGIAEAFKVMMENTYTDADFEKDIGLKD